MAKEDKNKEQQEEALENAVSAAHFFHFPSDPLRPLSAPAFWERCHPVKNFLLVGTALGGLEKYCWAKHIFLIKNL